MYPEIMVIPMREELTRLGIEELRSAADVDRFVQKEAGTNFDVCIGAGNIPDVIRHGVEDHSADLVLIGRGRFRTSRAGCVRTLTRSSSTCPVR